MENTPQFTQKIEKWNFTEVKFKDKKDLVLFEEHIASGKGTYIFFQKDGKIYPHPVANIEYYSFVQKKVNFLWDNKHKKIVSEITISELDYDEKTNL